MKKRTAKWRANHMLREVLYEWKLYFECLGYYLWHYLKFRKMKMKFKTFHWQMEYFTLVDPQIKQIKSLWNAMEEIQKRTISEREETGNSALSKIENYIVDKSLTLRDEKYD